MQSAQPSAAHGVTSASRAWRVPRVRWALGVLALLLITATAADLLASDLPLALRLHGELHLLPCVTRPAALRALDNQRIAAQLTAADWAIMPPAPWGENSHDLSAVLVGPSARHWLGTDSTGRDVLARVVHGTRVSLAVGLGSVLLLSSIGLAVGLCAGYFGGPLDPLLMRTADGLHAVPTMLLLVTLLSVLRPTGTGAVLAMLCVIGAVRWTDLSRLVRAEVLRVRDSAYVEAARALGLGVPRILARHVLPNVLSPVLVAASFSMAGAVMLEGALSFLGFGVPDDVASWGSLLNEVREHTQAWWLALFPGGAMFVSVSAYNLLGEALRDAIDPRLEM